MGQLDDKSDIEIFRLENNKIVLVVKKRYFVVVGSVFMHAYNNNKTF